MSVGFFGGKGFIMQKLEGDGLVFVHAVDTVLKRELQPGQTLGRLGGRWFAGGVLGGGEMTSDAD